MVWSRENIFYNIWRQTFRSVCLKFPLLLKNPTAQVEIFHKLDDIFSEIDITSIYDKPNEFDYNDRYYLKLAEKEGIKIVTNDADFYSNLCDVEIITANKNLLCKNSV